MRRVAATVAVLGVFLVGCGRAEQTSPTTTNAPAVPTDPPVVATPAPQTAPVAESAPGLDTVAETSLGATTVTSRPSMIVARPSQTASTTSSSPSTSSSSSSTSSSSTSTTLPPLPVPIAPPEETGRRDPEMVLGRIEIPAIELDSELQEGIRIPTLDDGPGHWPGSAMPGELGNVVVAGHRTSNGAEFRHLDDLVVGDEVIMTTPQGRFVYLVESIEIVGPDALWIVTQTHEHRATLFACHPPGSVAERIVAHLRLSGA